MARPIKPEQFYEPTNYNVRTKSERHLMCRYKAMRLTKAQARYAIRCALEDGFLPERTTNAYITALASNDAVARRVAAADIRARSVVPGGKSWRENDGR